MARPRPQVDTPGMNLLRRHFRLIDPGEWSEPGNDGRRPRILVENPDQALLWSISETLREEGYEVATCTGPVDGARCPMIEFGYCPLADEADVVISSTKIADARELLAAHAYNVRPPLVIEAEPEEVDETARLVPDAVVVAAPLTAERLLGAVAEARSA